MTNLRHPFTVDTQQFVAEGESVAMRKLLVSIQVSIVVALWVLLTAVVAVAQCKPGEPVEYRAQSWPEKWEVGTCVKELPGGKQVLVREKPSQFYPEGFERAYALADVRPARTVPEEPPRNDNRAKPDRADEAKPLDEPNDNGPANAPGGPAMSQQDILSFLKQRLGDGDPFMNPKREQVLQQLREDILKRGVNFHYVSIGDFVNQLGKFGALSNVTAALNENFGAPAKRNELFGKWLFSKVGAPGNPMYAKSGGALTISANGTYVWDTGSGIVRGSWRNATAEEMGGVDKGGEGIVLLKGKGGWDWIAARRDEEGPAGKGIKLHNLPDHSLRERGTRG